MIKKLLCLICLVALCAGAGKGLYWATKGFTYRRIQGPVHRQLEIWNSEADIALSQRYHYIGRGRQCFAFESEDGKYVLKLPRTDIYQIPLWLRFLPLKSAREKLHTAQAKQEAFILESFRIAYENLREETGVIALHIGRTEPKGKHLTIYNALGSKFQLPAERTTFVLQYKHPILMKAFLAALKKEDRKEAMRILDAFIEVVVDRGKKGIWNRDESFLRNYGFDGQKAFQIDVGSFYYKANGDASIHDTMHPVRTWLRKIDPEMLQFFDRTLEAKL